MCLERIWNLMLNLFELTYEHWEHWYPMLALIQVSCSIERTVKSRADFVERVGQELRGNRSRDHNTSFEELSIFCRMLTSLKQ